MASGGASRNASIVAVLGGRSALRLKGKGSPTELRDALRKGLRFESLTAASQALHISERDLSAVVGLPQRTLVRRRLQGQLTPEESDRLFRLARLAAFAEEVLGGSDRASEWLQRPNRALGGDAPLQRLDTDIGSREVEDVLGRIAHGIAG